MLTGVRWYLPGVLMCISLTVSERAPSQVSIGHLYVFLHEMAIKALCPFFNWVIVFLLLSCLGSLYILDIDPLPDVWLANIFSHPIDCLFTLLVSFAVCRRLSLRQSHLSTFAFVASVLGSHSQNHCPDQC